MSHNLSTLNRYEDVAQISSRSVDELCALATEACGAEACVIGLCDPRGQAFQSAIGLRPATVRSFAPLWLYVLNSGAPVKEDDARAIEGLAGVIDPAVRSFLGVPLRDESQHPLGVLSLYRSAPHVFSERDLRLAAGFGREVARQLDLRRRLAQIRERHLHQLDALDTLRGVTQLKDDFISMMSHELRTPLTALLGALDLTAAGVAGALPADVAELVAIARDNGRRLLRLVNDILDLQKLEAGLFQIDRAPCDLRAVVDGAVERLRPLGAARGTAIVIRDEAAPAPIPVEGDAERLAQVIVNLLSNALKFSPPDGEVVITLGRRHDGAASRGRPKPHAGVARVSVADHGPGIPADFRDRIFSRFAQASTHDVRMHGGTGLGLNIVKSLVELHDGRVWFESPPGAGATFHVEIPLAG